MDTAPESNGCVAGGENSNVNRLQALIEKEVREHGLLDYRLFPNASRDITEDDIARDAVSMHEAFLGGGSELLFSVKPE